MLVLRAFVRDGTIPLLGPPTSIGDFHHGALYYYLLAPVVAVFGADPFWVVAAIAAANVAAVAVTWWLARSIAGPSGRRRRCSQGRPRPRSTSRRSSGTRT